MESADKLTRSIAGGDREATHSSWSAAIGADFENSNDSGANNNDNDNVLPGIRISSSPSDEKENRRGGSSMTDDRDGVASLPSMEEKKMSSVPPPRPPHAPPVPIDGTTASATMIPPRITTIPSAEATHHNDPLPSPKSSPFRRSLDEEHRAKSRLRQMEDVRTQESKRMLRESVRSLSAARDDNGGEVLTRPERNFLELLLEDRGPGAGEACVAAHKRLMDGNLFFWTMCGGAAGEVDAPGHGWTVGSGKTAANPPLPPRSGIVVDEDETPMIANHKKIDSGDGWVKDWVARGSQESNGSQDGEVVKTQASGEKTSEEKKGEGSRGEPAKEDGRITMNGKEEPVPDGFKTPHNHSSNGSLSDHADTNDYAAAAVASVRPTHQLQRRQSSDARLARLDLRRRQSSSGLDNCNRLFRAHEAGLVVSQQGSARRSLMRMGLPMERGLFGGGGGGGMHRPPPMPLVQDLSRSKTDAEEDEEDGKVDRNRFPNFGLDLTAAPEAEGDAAVMAEEGEAESMNPDFQRALAKLDERTIRRIEKEERAKQNKSTLADQGGHQLRPVSPMTADLNPAGCISPFSMSVLRRMFASKQFSFHRGSSSYTRFDSFLNSASTAKSMETAASGVLSELDNSLRLAPGMMSELDNSLRLDNRKEDIFRQSPRRASSTGERLKNLLVNAGFKDDGSDDRGDVGEGGGGHQPVIDAKWDDDADILSQSTNSVAQLMRGGPSYRNVDMFRGDSNDDREKIAGANDVDVLDAESDDDADILSQSTNSVAQLMRGGPSYRNVDMFRETPSKTRGRKDRRMMKKMNLTVQASRQSSSSLFSSLGSTGPPSPPSTGDVKGSPSADIDVSPAGSDVGDLPMASLPPRRTSKVDRLSQSECTSRGRHRLNKRHSTVGIIKNSSVSSTMTDNNAGAAGGKSSKSPVRRPKYKRSVSWGHMVFSKEETKAALLARQESDAVSIASGMSVISFPNLRRAAPLQRSDSVASVASALDSIAPLRLGEHLRSESTTASVVSMLSHAPSLSRAYPVFSPRPSFSSGIGPPLLTHANSVHSIVTQQSDFQRPTLGHANSEWSDFRRPTLGHANSVHSIVRSGTTGTEIINDDDSLNSAEFVDARPNAPRGAAWESPRKPPHNLSRSETSGSEDHPVFIRQASYSNYARHTRLKCTSTMRAS